ncbi:hypothetical protein LSH36_135g03008 [Paralvinella palmiformis]|uniref:Uncharacterized protein n=1 Tax=Paralvinella palmiformis TaxID=53620 RepID=A0AAD9JW08_9ANNE|nr:hypothetical protein LSH36_135g03008 [Paralvinella palmiformis]
MGYSLILSGQIPNDDARTIDEPMIGELGGWMDGWMNGWTDGRGKDEWIHACSDERMNALKSLNAHTAFHSSPTTRTPTVTKRMTKQWQTTASVVKWNHHNDTELAEEEEEHEISCIVVK